LSVVEAAVLAELASAPGGAFGSEMVHRSQGRLKRGSVYATLGRLEAAGFVKSRDIAPTSEFALARTRYFITADGARARQEFAQFTGFALPSIGAGVV
jgi:DNA-binding PadR family transcriptional regulator